MIRCGFAARDTNASCTWAACSARGRGYPVSKEPYLLALAQVDAQETPSKRAQTPNCWDATDRLKRPDISDRKIAGNWEGDLIIGQDGASACATLVERTTRYLIIVALPLGRKADQVCDAPPRRIQGLPDGAMRTLTWDQGREMDRHQRLTRDTGVDVFFAHPQQPLGERNQRKHQPAHPPLPTQRNPHHQPPTLLRRHRLRTGQLPQSHPRLPHPNRSTQRTHCYHPSTPPDFGCIRFQI